MSMSGNHTVTHYWNGLFCRSAGTVFRIIIATNENDEKGSSKYATKFLHLTKIRDGSKDFC